MYLEHFGLTRNPFSATPDPRFLFLTPRHREALAALLFAVTERKGFLVMTGDAGTGKTTLIRKLLLSIPEACAQFSVVVNPVQTREELFESILLDFGMKDVPTSKAQRLALFRERLLAAQASGRTSVLVIDEAHLLTEELMEEVRLLSNFETADQKLLQIVLAGQGELERVLGLESMRQVKQRIAIRAKVDPLAEAEVKRYLETRWSRAATGPLPFSEEAILLVARGSRGIPRSINMICDAALVNAYGAGTHAIGKREIEEVLRDLGIGPVALRMDVKTPALTEGLPHVRLHTTSAATSTGLAAYQPLERIPVESETPPIRKPGRRWKVAHWFGVASGEAK